MIYSRELGLKALQDFNGPNGNHCSLLNALALYHRLKGTGKNQLFYDLPRRSIPYLSECLGHENLSDIKILMQDGSETICLLAACNLHRSKGCSLQSNQLSVKQIENKD